MSAVVTISDRIRFIESAFGAARVARNEKNVEVRCPFCAPRDVTKRKLVIHVETGMVHCWVCGYKARTLVPLLKKFGTRDRLIEYLDRFVDLSNHHRAEALEVETSQHIKLPNDFRMLVAHDPDPDSKAALRYLIDRGLQERDLWYYRLGVSDELRWRRRIIVPSFDSSGELNYFVARAIDAQRRPKYDNPDVDKLPIIFNELNVDWRRRLTLVEGVFDMFSCGDNTVPLLGSDLNEESLLFNRIIALNTPVALALDADMWETKLIRTAKKLIEYDVDVMIVDTRPFGDPGQASKKQMKEAIRSAKPYSWESNFKTKLNRAVRVGLSV